MAVSPAISGWYIRMDCTVKNAASYSSYVAMAIVRNRSGPAGLALGVPFAGCSKWESRIRLACPKASDEGGI
jgi:hypothetical protein